MMRIIKFLSGAPFHGAATWMGDDARRSAGFLSCAWAVLPPTLSLVGGAVTGCLSGWPLAGLLIGASGYSVWIAVVEKS